MGVGITGNRVNADVDAVANQARGDGIANRRRFADRSTVELLVDVAVAFAHDVLLQNLAAVHLNPSLNNDSPSASNNCKISHSQPSVVRLSSPYAAPVLLLA